MGGEPIRRGPFRRGLHLVGSSSLPESQAPDEAAIVLPGQRRSVTVGRHWVVNVAADAGITGMANQVVELLTSELLANAVLHGAPGEGIGLRVRWDEETIRVSVSDQEHAEPVVLHPEPVALSGRGMAIVEAMSSRWGVETEPDGKSVWFELDLDEF